jgi:hypothetical protein
VTAGSRAMCGPDPTIAEATSTRRETPYGTTIATVNQLTAQGTGPAAILDMPAGGAGGREDDLQPAGGAGGPRGGQPPLPKVPDELRAAEADVLAYMSSPLDHWSPSPQPTPSADRRDLRPKWWASSPTPTACCGWPPALADARVRRHPVHACGGRRYASMIRSTHRARSSPGLPYLRPLEPAAGRRIRETGGGDFSVIDSSAWPLTRNLRGVVIRIVHDYGRRVVGPAIKAPPWSVSPPCSACPYWRSTGE